MPTLMVSRRLARSLRWRHNGRDSVSNHQPHDCLFNRLFRRRSKETSKRRVTGLCAGNSPGTGEFPAQIASNAENVSIWWRHHEWRDSVLTKIYNTWPWIENGARFYMYRLYVYVYIYRIRLMRFVLHMFAANSINIFPALLLSYLSS